MVETEDFTGSVSDISDYADRDFVNTPRLFDARGVRRDMDICRQKDHKPWSRPSFCGLSGYGPKIWHPGLLG